MRITEIRSNGTIFNVVVLGKLVRGNERKGSENKTDVVRVMRN
jgi:hypothetical protein